MQLVTCVRLLHLQTQKEHGLTGADISCLLHCFAPDSNASAERTTLSSQYRHTTLHLRQQRQSALKEQRAYCNCAVILHAIVHVKSQTAFFLHNFVMGRYNTVP